MRKQVKEAAMTRQELQKVVREAKATRTDGSQAAYERWCEMAFWAGELLHTNRRNYIPFSYLVALVQYQCQQLNGELDAVELANTLEWMRLCQPVYV
jgi:hypothetical protein